MNAPQNLNSAARPVCVLIAALGGEGGGVLKDWVVHTAHAAGYPVQATSIPGVAQRTGATTYYVEIFPVTHAALGGRKPVLCLSPTAGQVDFFIGSELMEAARQMQAGLRQADLKGLAEAGGAIGCGQMAHSRPLAFT